MRRTAAGMLGFLALAACGPTGTTGAGGGTGGGGGGTGGGMGVDAGPDLDLICDANPAPTSFGTVYAQVFPACTGCHRTGVADGSDAYGVYSTQSVAFAQVGAKSKYAGTAGTLKVVDPNNLGNSAMWLKVLARSKSPGGQSLGGAMPLGEAPLTAAQKQLMKDWICTDAGM